MTTEEKAEMWRKFTIEQKADVYQLRIANRYQAKMNVSTTILEEEVKHAYLAGAAEALRSQWISVDERLPEDGQYAFIKTDSRTSSKYGYAWVALLSNGTLCWYTNVDYLDTERIRYWMPIPETPDTQEQ